MSIRAPSPKNRVERLIGAFKSSVLGAVDSVTFLVFALLRWANRRRDLGARSRVLISYSTGVALILGAPVALAQISPAQPPAATPPAPGATPSPAPAPAPKFVTVRVAMQTTEGLILLELEKQRAPITTANFLKYVDQKRWDGVTFYRATNIAKDPLLGLIQGGARNDPKRLFPPIAHEPTTKTGLSNSDGAISMARGKPGSANADFFIIVGDMTSLNADPKAAGDNLGFAAFGRVVEGMDVVRKILAAPISPTLGAGIMKGQMLAKPVKVLSARRVN